MEARDRFFEQTLLRARVFVDNAKFGQAYALFLLLVKLDPEKKSSVEDEFCDIWYVWSSELIRLNMFDKMVELYFTGCEYFLECERFHMIAGDWFYKLHEKLKAHDTYNYVLEINSKNMDARQNLDNLCRSIIDNWHYDMLNDSERNWTFFNGIKECISGTFARNGRGNVNIIDIGSGTGLLSMFSAMHENTSAVVACECDPVMARLGKDIIQSNGYKEKITFHACMSMELSISGHKYEIPFNNNRANIVISEIIDAGVFGEGIVPSIDHAWRELLVPYELGGRVIPSKAIIHVACIDSERIHQQHCGNIKTTQKAILVVSNVGIEVDAKDLTGCWHSMTSTLEPYTCGRIGNWVHRMLTDYEIMKEVNFNNAKEMSELAASVGVPFSVELVSISDGYLDAVTTSFDLVMNSTNPSHTLKTHIGSESCWEQCIYPIRSVTTSEGSFQFSRIFVKKNSSIVLNFLQYSDKVTLDSCVVCDGSETIVFPQKNPFQVVHNNDLCVISLPDQDMAKINNVRYLEFFYKSLPILELPLSTCTNSETVNIYDLYQARPVLALCIAGKFSQVNICRVKEKSQLSRDFQDCTQRLALSNLTCIDRIPGLQFSAAIIDVVEHSGLLSETIFARISEYRQSIHPNGYLFPCKLKVMGQVVESEQLLKRCIVPEKSATIDLDIGSHLQRYRPSTLSHLTMQNIKHKNLSEPFMCEEIDFKDCSVEHLSEKQLSIFVDVSCGIVHGILIWYVLVMNDGLNFDTLDPANSWQQCVFMHSNVLEVENQVLSLIYRRKSSYVSFDFVQVLPTD